MHEIFLIQTGGEYMLLCETYKMLTLEEDGTVNLLFPVGLAWEMCSFGARLSVKRVELSRARFFLYLASKLVGFKNKGVYSLMVGFLHAQAVVKFLFKMI
jgi:hypothetical protein